MKNFDSLKEIERVIVLLLLELLPKVEIFEEYYLQFLLYRFHLSESVINLNFSHMFHKDSVQKVGRTIFARFTIEVEVSKIDYIAILILTYCIRSPIFKTIKLNQVKFNHFKCSIVRNQFECMLFLKIY